MAAGVSSINLSPLIRRNTLHSNKQASIRSAHFSGGGRATGPPAFGCDARALNLDRVRRRIGEVPRDLPADGPVGIEEPLDVREPARVIVQPHWFFMARGVQVWSGAPNRVHLGYCLGRMLEEAFLADCRPSGSDLRHAATAVLKKTGNK